MTAGLAEALGHLRQAAHQLLAADDPTGRSMALATEILDIENLLEELGIEPAWVPTSPAPAQSLTAAARLLSNAADMLPSDIWPTLHTVLLEADGHGHG